MIVSTMTHDEVYAELERDREAVTRWWGHTLEAQKRRAIKCERFPLNLTFDYTSPRRVRYIFHTRIFDKRMRYILTGVLALRRESDGFTAYSTWLGYQRFIAPIVYLPHAFHRYAERVGVNKTGAELVRHFFITNPIGNHTRREDCFARSVRYNGEDHIALCLTEGALLGNREGNYFIARTFITYDMCSGQQREEFESRRRSIVDDRELYDRATMAYEIMEDYGISPFNLK